MSRIHDLEARLERTEQQLRLFQRVSRMMARESSLDTALDEVVQSVCEFLQCDSCLIYLVEEGELILRASNEITRKNIGRVRLKLAEGLTGWVAREKRLLAISRDAYNDPRFKFFSDLPQDTFEAFLSVPITSHNKVVGVINVQHREAHTHTGNDMEMLNTLGEQIGCMLVLLRESPAAAGIS